MKITKRTCLRYVLKTRTESIGCDRKFKFRKTNFVDEIGISWPENDVIEPPLLKHISSDFLKEFIRKTS